MTGAFPQESLLQAVQECARVAGSFALAHYRTGVAVEAWTNASLSRRMTSILSIKYYMMAKRINVIKNRYAYNRSV